MLSVILAMSVYIIYHLNYTLVAATISMKP